MTSIEILFLIALLSSVQSVIGVGLLVFGTPTLVLLGFQYDEILSLVLPPSIAISCLQTFELRDIRNNFYRDFNFFCLPFVFIGLVMILHFSPNTEFLKYPIGSMLVLSGLIRLSPALDQLLSKFIYNQKKLFLFIIGSIHGLTNMSGGLLTLYSSSLNNRNKELTRHGIAYGYLIMGSLQYIVLIFLKPHFFSISTLLHTAVAIFIYRLFGKLLFKSIKETRCRHIVSSVIFFYGIALILK
jgi:hypothetical protein